jgi:hypothetical protein
MNRREFVVNSAGGLALALVGKARWVLRACRAYSKRLGQVARHFHYHSPVFIALAKVENDCEFLKLFKVLLPHAWT